jgi:4-amino-4-deoxy-L-arabinose transferase-like glycosyltransferase
MLACALIAAYLMYSGLSYGLPLYYHPDEPRKAVAAFKLAHGAVPDRFNHPQFMLVFSAPFIHIGKALDIHPLLAGRAAVATLGVATVCLLYWVGSMLGGPLAGSAAALLYATAPLAVVAAHDFKEDVPLAFWLSLQLLFLVRYIRNGGSRDLYLAALAVGGAVGTKYTGLMGIPLLAVGFLWGSASHRRWEQLLLTLPMMIGGFLVTTPTVLANPAAFLLGLSFEVQHALFGHGMKQSAVAGGGISIMEPGSYITISPIPYLWTYHLRYSLAPGLSVAGLLLAGAGAVMTVRGGSRRWWLVVASLGLFYTILESLPLKPPPFAARYMVTVLPPAVLLGGGAVALAWQRGPLLKGLVSLLFVATIGINSYESARQVAAMRPDTRDMAREWAYAHLPRGARLILPGLIFYTPFGGSFDQPDVPFELIDLQTFSFSEVMEAGLDRHAYVVVSSFNYQRHLEYPNHDPDASRFYRTLFERYTPLATFAPPFPSLGFHNPTIQIFRLSEDLSAPPTVQGR